MGVSLEIIGGPRTGDVIELSAGEAVRFGRGSAADYPLPQDPQLSSLHFEIAFDGSDCTICDLKSTNGTFVDNRQIRRQTLANAQEINAGQSRFRVVIEDDAALRRRVVQMLAQAQPLYAILDAARTPAIAEILNETTERFESLYEGESAAHLGACAPYLVRLPERSRLLRRLVRQGWGQAWGVYLVSDVPFEGIRKHLRHFLKIKGEDGEHYYFRFYDPRVLRVFLPACTPEQDAEFFGPVRSYIVERGRGLGAKVFSSGVGQGEPVTGRFG